LLIAFLKLSRANSLIGCVVLCNNNNIYRLLLLPLCHRPTVSLHPPLRTARSSPAT
jgi:hypothetical protein